MHFQLSNGAVNQNCGVEIVTLAQWYLHGWVEQNPLELKQGAGPGPIYLTQGLGVAVLLATRGAEQDLWPEELAGVPRKGQN